MPTLRYTQGGSYSDGESQQAAAEINLSPSVNVDISADLFFDVFSVRSGDGQSFLQDGTQNTLVSPIGDGVFFDFSEWTASVSLNGGNQGDRLRGGTGANMLNGAAGDDTILGASGIDTIIGGDGTDTVDYRNSAAGVEIDLLFGTGLGGDAEGDTYRSIESVFGSQENDTIRGSNALFEGLSGLGGDDVLVSRSDETFLDGGEGNDRIYVSEGLQYVFGGAGRDVLIFRASDSADAPASGLYNDFNTPVGIESVVLTAGANVGLSDFGQSLGPITIRTGDAATTLTTTEFSTKVTVTGNGDFDLTTGRGDDTITLNGFLAENSSIDTGQGRDVVTFAGSQESGTFLTDANFSGVEEARVNGGYDFSGVSKGLRIVLGRGFNDVAGTAGDDIITASGGKYSRIDGGAGNDIITSGNGFQTIIEGGEGRDRMYAGTGQNTFVFDSTAEMTGDKIFGFDGSNDRWEAPSDMIDVRGLEESLGKELFFIGESNFFFADGAPFFQVRTEVKANGDISLQFDTDNNGVADASIFVRLADGAPPLDENDFITLSSQSEQVPFVAPHEPIHDALLGVIA